MADVIDHVSGEVLAVGAMLLFAAEAGVRRCAAPDDGDAQVVASLLRQIAFTLDASQSGFLDVSAVTPRQRQLIAELLVDPVLVAPATRYVRGAGQLADVFAGLADEIVGNAG